MRLPCIPIAPVTGYDMLRDMVRPYISIIVPVYREGPAIVRHLRHLQGLPAHPSFEIIVMDGDPLGRTIGVIRNAGIRTGIAVRGRGPQMNAGAQRARGAVFLFLHADTRLPRDGLNQIVSICRFARHAGGAFDLAIDNPRPIYRIIETAASWRSRITRTPYGDQAIFIKRQCFERLNGFAPVPIMEDVDLMQRLKIGGGRIAFSSKRVRTSARRWETEGVMRCTLRNWTIMGLYLAGVSPVRLARYYR